MSNKRTIESTISGIFPATPTLSRNPDRLGYVGNPLKSIPINGTNLNYKNAKLDIFSDVTDSYNTNTNHRLVANKLRKKNKHFNFDLANQIVFERTDAHDVKTTSHSQWCAFTTIPEFNVLAANTEPRPKSMDDFVPAKKFFENFAFIGIVSNGDNDRPDDGKNVYNNGEGINVVGFFGHVATKKIWIEEIHPGDDLYVILKKVNCTNNPYYKNKKDQGIEIPFPDVDHTSYPYQLVPWTNGKTLPMRKDVFFYDEFDCEHEGLVIHIGTSLHYYPRTNAKYTTQQIMSSPTTVLGLPLIEIALKDKKKY